MSGVAEDFAVHGRPVSAANVSRPTNRSAAVVMTTVMPAPACTNWLMSAAVLYAAMPPVTPIRISRPVMVGSRAARYMPTRTWAWHSHYAA